MTNRQRVGVRTAASDFTAPPQVDITQWVEVDEAAVPPARQRQFLNRKRAIVLYLGGANEAQLLQETGLKRRNVYRIIVERSTIPQIQTRFANRAQICIIGPSFDFQPDALTWVRNNLRANAGDRCSCR